MKILHFNQQNKQVGFIEAHEMELEEGLMGWVLSNIHVDKECRKQGIGEGLLTSMLKNLADKNEIVAHCNEFSKSMLLKAGFTEKVENVMDLQK
jgi:ribosomal protein S18 acetylase RimI-like enzyme